MHRLLVVVLASLLGLLLPRATFAQGCSVQLTNAVGDTISGSATLNTTDPGENTEGESLTVSSSGGEITLNFTGYNLPAAFGPFKATAANEIITGTFTPPESFFDQSCS